MVMETELYGFSGFSDGLGSGYGPAPIPNNPALVSKTYFAQLVFVESAADGLACSASPYGIVTSRGLALTIQP